MRLASNYNVMFDVFASILRASRYDDGERSVSVIHTRRPRNHVRVRMQNIKNLETVVFGFAEVVQKVLHPSIISYAQVSELHQILIQPILQFSDHELLIQSI